MKVATFSLVIVFSLGTSACWVGKKKAVLVLPPPPQPALSKPAPVIAPSTDVVLPPTEAPITPPPVVRAPEPPRETPPEPAPEVKPPPVRKRRPSPRLPVQEAPKPAEPDTSAGAGSIPAAPVPQLREILTPDLRQQYENEYAASMVRARSALTKVAGRNLTGPQQEMLNRIRTFLGQAEESRKDDLGTAWQLARRADLLGQDLMESLR